jgi:hypothetical protein
MIVYEHNMIKRGEIWFDAEPDRPADVIEYMHRSAPVPGCRHVDFLTSLIDLRKTEEELFAAIRPEVRRQIRRAAESDLRFEMIKPVPQDVIEDFYRAYDALAAAKNLPALNAKIVASYNDAGKLALSRVAAPGDPALTWHAYFIADGRAAQLHSIANFRDDKETRNLVGRAHRFHTWMDIKQCRDDGLITFDFGGLYSGTGNQELLRVNAFKEEFGGVASRDYICERAMTTRGRLYLLARNLAKSGMLNSLQAARGE